MTATKTKRRDPFLGLTLAGKYEVVEPLARGGMGRVYRAIQKPLGREVALKVLDADQLEGQAAMEDFQQRFFLEAAACAKLQHPNTVVVYDYGKTDDGDLFIAMELLTGETLRVAIERSGTIAPSRAIHIALQICGSIGGAHDQGMVHRDLKPSNVMLTPRGADPDFVKVLDFGLVKQDDQGLTQSGALLGTPRYMAPEQIASTTVGPAADIYSLGAVLFHMLAGRPPFESESKFVLLASHMNEAAPPLREVNPDITASEELEAVVMRCLRKQPSERYPSMEALARALAFCPEDSDTANSSLPRSANTLQAPDPLEATSFARPKSSGGEKAALPSVNTPAESGGGAEEAGSPEVRPSAVPKIIIATALIGALLAVLAWALFLRPQSGEEVADVDSTTEPDTDGPSGMQATSAMDDPSVMADPSAMAETSEAPTLVQVEVQSDPPGARAMSDGRDLGDAPIILSIPRGETQPVTLSLSRHETRTIQVGTSQPTVRVRLERRRGRTPMMEAAMVEETPPAMMETTTTTMMSGTDNRDPWAN